MCVELNAHALIIYVLKIRDHFHGEGRFVLPWMLGSQTCEKNILNCKEYEQCFFHGS